MANITPSSGSITVTTQTKTADKYWIKNLSVVAPSTNKKVIMTCVLTPYNSTTGEMIDEKSVVVRIDDVFTLAQSNATVAEAMDKLFAAVDNVAKSKNLI